MYILDCVCMCSSPGPLRFDFGYCVVDSSSKVINSLEISHLLWKHSFWPSFFWYLLVEFFIIPWTSRPTFRCLIHIFVRSSFSIFIRLGPFLPLSIAFSPFISLSHSALGYSYLNWWYKSNLIRTILFPIICNCVVVLSIQCKTGHFKFSIGFVIFSSL